MSDFRNMTEVLNHVEKTIVIDLIPHVVALDSDPRLIEALYEPDQGIYLIGSVEPLVRLTGTYFTRREWESTRRPIQQKDTVEDLLALQDDILDYKGDILITLKDLTLKRRFFKNQPTVPSIGIKAAICVIEQYLVSVSRHSNRFHPCYRLEKLVDPSKGSKLIETDEYMHGFERLLDIVTEFVNGNHWNLYFTHLRGTSLVIQQGIDYRIFKYYQDQFKDADDDGEQEEINKCS